MENSLTVYGIPNCDTVKKSRAWFDAKGIAYRFHDFKKDGVTSELLEHWVSKLDWQLLLNTKGTTWRKLGESDRASVRDAASAIALMLKHSSVIKRPVVSNGDRTTVGFLPDKWQDM